MSTWGISKEKNKRKRGELEWWEIPPPREKKLGTYFERKQLKRGRDGSESKKLAPGAFKKFGRKKKVNEEEEAACTLDKLGLKQTKRPTQCVARDEEDHYENAPITQDDYAGYEDALLELLEQEKDEMEDQQGFDYEEELLRALEKKGE